MVNVIRFAAVLAVFVVAVTGVVWTTAAAERRTAEQEFAEREAADAMVSALLARESALRGYAQATRASFLEPYDEASATLADASDRARSFAAGDDEERASIEEQERLATRWAALANDTIIRLRNGRPVTVESSLIRADLIERSSARTNTSSA